MFQLFFFNQQGMNQGNSFDHYWQIRWSCIFMIFTSPNQHGWVWKRTWQCSQCMPRFTESDGFVDQQRCFRWEDIGKIGKFWNAPPPIRSDKWRQYVSCPRDPRCNVILGGRASQARCTFDRQRGHQTYPNMPLCIPSALPIFPPSTFAPIKIELAIFRGPSRVTHGWVVEQFPKQVLRLGEFWWPSTYSDGSQPSSNLVWKFWRSFVQRLWYWGSDFGAKNSFVVFLKSIYSH